MRRKHYIKPLLVLLVAQTGWAGVFDKDYSDLDDFLIMAAPKDAIPAMTNPTFIHADEVTYTDPSDLGTHAYLADTDRVLGIYHQGVAKAYPLNLGWWHEVINDQIGDRFIAATYCPLTGTGLVFNTTTSDGDRIELGVSGWLLNSNLIMYDRRDGRTLYPQMVFTGINSTYKGEKLKLLPVVETTWGLWKTLHPTTQAPRFDSGLEAYSERRRKTYADRAGRYYESEGGYPYGTYRTDNDILFPLTTNELDLNGLHIKDMVLGICQDNQTKAYPLSTMPNQAIINDTLGTQALLVIFHAPSRTAIPYNRIVNNRTLTFYAATPADASPLAFKDVETGSRWNILGQAMSGPLAGQQLEQIPAYNSMWFAWKAYWPQTALWAGEGILDAVAPTAIEANELAPQPVSFFLEQNRPNPFNPWTQIQYHLPQSAHVRLNIFNAAGQQVQELINAHQPAGQHQVLWDGRDMAGIAVSSGIYFYRLVAPQAPFNATRKMLLVR